MRAKQLGRQQLDEIYVKGKQARVDGKGIEACARRCNLERAWWKAGWHDMDIERGVSKYFGSVN